MDDTETAADLLYESALAQMRSANPDTRDIVAKLRRAIDGGSPQAAYALATWYIHGRDDVVPQDFGEALKLLRIAAEAHVAAALYDLAVCYANGEGVPKDLNQAFELYLKAALHGDDDSVFKVGQSYFYGLGVAEDRRVADIWLDRAYELGTFESEPETE